MREARTSLEHVNDVGLLNHVIWSFRIAAVGIGELYIEHLHTSHIGFVLSKEKSKFVELKRKRIVGLHHVGHHIGCIVLGHESRRHINRHHFSFRRIDILHNGSKSTHQRSRQACTEQTVNHHIAGCYHWRHEIRCNLVEIDCRTMAHTVFVCHTVGRQIVAYIEQIG